MKYLLAILAVVVAIVIVRVVGSTRQDEAQKPNDAELVKRCAAIEIPDTELDTTLDTARRTVEVRWFSGEEQKNIMVLLPYYPETNFVGCSESARRVLRHVQAIQMNESPSQ